jgi:hypothetical protein
MPHDPRRALLRRHLRDRVRRADRAGLASVTINFHPDQESGVSIGAPPGPPPGPPGGSAPTGLPGIPVTTDKRHPSERIRPGDHVRDMSETQRTGIVDFVTHVEVRDRRGWVSITDWAMVLWNDGASEDMLWGSLERIPAAISR